MGSEPTRAKPIGLALGLALAVGISIGYLRYNRVDQIHLLNRANVLAKHLQRGDKFHDIYFTNYSLLFYFVSRVSIVSKIPSTSFNI